MNLVFHEMWDSPPKRVTLIHPPSETRSDAAHLLGNHQGNPVNGLLTETSVVTTSHPPHHRYNSHNHYS